MSEIKSRADFFEAAAKMMRMCDEAGVIHTYKLHGVIQELTSACDGEFNRYEFPLAIIEGKPVFKGDELYSSGCTKPSKMIIENCDGENLYGSGCCIGISYMSWLPPKPKTVMVELSVEDADRFFNSYDQYPDGLHGRIARACCKALEELK